MARREHLRKAIDRLAADEQRAFAAEFLAPMLPGGTVQVRIAGVVCQLAVSPGDFKGWGIFRATSPRTALLVRTAGLGERQRYLELLPLLRAIVCVHDEREWLAIPANREDGRFQLDGLVPVRLVDETQLFEVVRARFDGVHCWYEGPDPRRDPGTAAYLRESLFRMVEPGKLSRPGLTVEERAAYVVTYSQRLENEIEARRDRVEGRLRATLAHASATLRDYQERGDVCRVSYDVDGRRHVSIVARDDLSVHIAGICLSGQDRRFDLQSLVGVLREARTTGGLVRVGNDGLRADLYWQVHPAES